MNAKANLRYNKNMLTALNKLGTMFKKAFSTTVDRGSGATGDHFVRLLGAGNGPQKLLVGHQNSRSPHPVLRFAK